MSKISTGDRVRVYGHCINGQNHYGDIGKVVAVNTDHSVAVDTGLGKKISVVHPKQCRKLRKVMRREWWIAIPPNDSEFRPTIFDHPIPVDEDIKLLSGKIWKITELIHVREVRKR